VLEEKLANVEAKLAAEVASLKADIDSRNK